MAYDPIIVAHRGLHDRYPENSMGAFREAGRAGVLWVECDVWASADGAAVVIHDETLERTTTGRGPVWAQRWEDLQKLRLRHADGRVDEHERLHSLVEMVTALCHCGFLVEVKPPDAWRLVYDVVETLKRYRRRWAVQSFDEANLIHALACDVNTPVAFLVEDRESLERGIAHGWKDVHLRHDLLDAPTAARLRDAGVSIGVWTVNTAEELGRVMALRADMIITDDPVLARRVLRRHQ